MVLALFPCHLHWIRLLLCRRDCQRNREVYVTRAFIVPGSWPIGFHLDATVQGIPNWGCGGESSWVILGPLHILPPRKVLPASKRGKSHDHQTLCARLIYGFQISRLYRPLDTDYVSDDEDEDDLEAGGVQLQATPQHQPKSAPANKVPETGTNRLGDVWDEREELFGVGGDSDED